MSLSRHRYNRVTGIPCAMVLTDSSVLSPVIGLVCHRHRRDAKASLPTWHQRRDARTTRLRRPRSAHSSRAPSRPSHPTPNVRDDREAPLERARDQVGLLLFLPKRKAKYFFKQDWTGSISLIQLNYLRGRRSGRLCVCRLPGTRSPAPSPRATMLGFGCRRGAAAWNSSAFSGRTVIEGLTSQA